MSLEELRKKFNRQNRLDPFVYRLNYRKTPFGPIKSEQMEKKWRAETVKEIHEKLPGFKHIDIVRERPDRFQKAERKRFKRLTGWVENLTAG